MRKKIGYVFFAFLCLFCMIGCQKKEPIELMPFENVEIKTTGWNKKAKVVIVSHKVHYTGNDETVQKLIHSLSYSVKDNKNLKNGDRVTINLIYDKKLAELANVKFDKTEYTYKVHGLSNDNRSVKTITKNKKDANTGENVDVAEQIITIDGVEIPASWNLSEEEIQDYVSYMKGMEDTDNTPDETGVKDDWIQGDSDVKTNRKNAKYYTKDYNNNDVNCYQAAYNYGQSSSQLYKVIPVIKDDKSVGYECIFKEKS